jgi:hypothetical protein
MADKMKDKAIETLKQNDNRIVRIKTYDGEVMIAKVRFVPDSKRDLIYDLVSTTREAQDEKHDEQSALRIGFEDIESVEAVDPSEAIIQERVNSNETVRAGGPTKTAL